MSITSMISRKSGAQASVGAHTEPPLPYAPRPKPTPPGPHQLGNITLQALDQITEKCAAEYDKAADDLEEAARVRAEGLRDCADRMRSIGFLASEKVSNFVKVMVTCADVSLATQGAVARCDEPQPDAPAETAQEPATNSATQGVSEGAATAPDLDAIEKQIGEVAPEAR